MERNLADALRQHARNRGNVVALIEADRRITYAELDALVDRGARALIERGCKPGEVVGLSLRDHWAHVVMMWACMRAGVVMLPLDFRWTAAERRAVVEHFGAVRVVRESDAQVDEAPSDPWPDLLDPSCDRLTHAFPQTDLASPLLLSLSSGTTGRPKGPLITHRHFLRRFYTHWINLGLNANSRYVCATPLYFGGGRTFTLSVLFSGGQVSMCVPPLEPAALADHVREHDANALFLVPTQLRRLLQAPATVREVFMRVGLMISSGAPLQPNERIAIVEHLCPNFHEYYASTEGGGVTLSDPLDLLERPSTVGRPIFGVEAQVVDEADRPLAPRQVGILRYRGPGVAKSFHQDPEQTATHFRSGWFYPGDLAEIDHDGYVFLRGRSKDMIIRGGINIYPNEIEDVLMRRPEIRECSVLGLPDPDLSEIVAVAWVGAKPISQEELLAYCREQLAPYKVPAHWMALESLPANSGGKVVKSQLREMFRQA